MVNFTGCLSLYGRPILIVSYSHYVCPCKVIFTFTLVSKLNLEVGLHNLELPFQVISDDKRLREEHKISPHPP